MSFQTFTINPAPSEKLIHLTISLPELTDALNTILATFRQTCTQTNEEYAHSPHFRSRETSLFKISSSKI